MRAHPEIVGLGVLAVDDTIYVDKPFALGKGRIVRRERALGGNIPMALAAAQVLGAVTEYKGWLSTEPEWKFVADEFISLGVGLGYCAYSAAATPIQSTILVDSEGDRFIAFNDETLVKPPLEPPLEDVPRNSVLLVDSYTVSSIIPALSEIRSRGIQIVGDIEFNADENCLPATELIDHPVLPLGFAKEITKESDPELIIKALWNDNRNTVVITDGERGSYWRDKASPGINHEPAFKIDIVDTTGCGDVFHGAYAASLADGSATWERVRLANACAAVVGSHSRGTTQRLVISEVEQILASYPRGE